MALANIHFTGEPGSMKRNPKLGNQNEPKNWRARKVFPLSRKRNTQGIRINHTDPLGSSVEVKLLPGNCSNTSSRFVWLVG